MIHDGLLWRLFENRDGTGCNYPKFIEDRGIHEGIPGGHLEVDKSLGKLKETFYWPGHYNDVKQ